MGCVVCRCAHMCWTCACTRYVHKILKSSIGKNGSSFWSVASLQGVRVGGCAAPGLANSTLRLRTPSSRDASAARSAWGRGAPRKRAFSNGISLFTKRREPPSRRAGGFFAARRCRGAAAPSSASTADGRRRAGGPRAISKRKGPRSVSVRRTSGLRRWRRQRNAWDYPPCLALSPLIDTVSLESKPNNCGSSFGNGHSKRRAPALRRSLQELVCWPAELKAATWGEETMRSGCPPPPIWPRLPTPF